MGALRRFFDRLTESDEARLATEVREWAATVPGSVPIAAARPRERAKIAGQIRRLTVFPMKDNESLEAVVSDGSGEIVVRFTGRRAIGGLGLGTKVVLEGLVAERKGVITMMNPQLEFTG
jgi:RecG-like helicase